MSNFSAALKGTDTTEAHTGKDVMAVRGIVSAPSLRWKRRALTFASKGQRLLREELVRFEISKLDYCKHHH